MNLAQIDPKIVSITALRRNMGLLEKILASQKEAYVCRNQSVLFIAMTPDRYFEFKKQEEKMSKSLKIKRSLK